MDDRSRAKNTLAASAVALVLAACAQAGTESSTVSPEQALRSAKIGLADAIATAEAEVPGGVTFAGEFEFEDGKSLFEVELLVGDEVREVFIDPASGDVVETKTDPEDLEPGRAAAAALAASEVSLADAIAAAQRKTGGLAFEVEVEGDAFEVGLLTDAGAVEVEISLGDGSVVEVEDDEDGMEEGEDGEEEDDEEGEDEEDEEGDEEDDEEDD